ncbi:MAG: hypothetical protein KF716_34365 [Anaerolineae bacterium]|nr:hypothetical protein [Anaerolineae bacterium]
MRRLIVWIAILMSSLSLPLIGVRTLRPAPTNTSCLQLLAPTTGDVVMVDLSTGAASLDARNAFPIPLATPISSYYAPLSPDQTRFVEANNVTEAGPPAFKLSIRKPSTTYRRLLTPSTVAERFVWSHDSRYVAFTEMRGWGANGPVVNFAIADAATSHVNREVIAESLDDGWFNRTREFVWSPDSTLVALTMYRSNVGATLALRSPDSDQSTYLSFPNEQINYIGWSPDSQIVVIITLGSTGYNLFIIHRNGQLLKQTAFYPYFYPYLVPSEDSGSKILEWSSDGQYFFFTQNAADKLRIDIYNLNGERQLAEPLVVKSPFLWSSLPHTLIYGGEQSDRPTLYTLDASTGISTLLIDDIEPYSVSPSPDSSMLAIITSTRPNYFTPHLISVALDQHTTPFGTFESVGQYFPRLSPITHEHLSNVFSRWSPDSKSIMLTAENASFYTIRWLRIQSGMVQQLQFPKQELPYERLDGFWLTNEIIWLSQVADGRQTVWLLDTHSATKLLFLSATDIDSYNAVWFDDSYILARNSTTTIISRLIDGAAVFSFQLPTVAYGVPYMEPYERAVLLFRPRDSSMARPTLYLITGTSTVDYTAPMDLTRPAWSSDGEMFAYVAKDDYTSGWRLEIMSRNGTRLKELPVQPLLSNLDLYYEQVRWTNCD